MEVTRKSGMVPGEIATLANELAEASERLHRFHGKYAEPDEMEHSAIVWFLDKGKGDTESLERIETAPGERLTWSDFDWVAAQDEERMLEAWRRTCDEALSEFRSGHRAAKVLEVVSNPWERAKFLSLRESFRDEWNPRGGIEDSMIDAMAQAYTQYEFWIRMLAERSQAIAVRQKKQIEKYCQWSPPEQDAADAVEQAGAMAERFHRLYLRTIRAMRDYRRYNGPVVVQSAGQVNVGGQHVNVVGTIPD